MTMLVCLPSEQPRQELRREERQSPVEDDAADLALGAAFAEHEHQPADDDGDERQRSREWSGEGRFKVRGGAFPWRLREGHGWAEHDPRSRLPEGAGVVAERGAECEAAG